MPKAKATTPEDFTPACAAEIALRALGGRWKMGLLLSLGGGGPRGFNTLLAETPGVTRRVLAAQLSALERDGLVARSVVSEKLLRVSYALTGYGADAMPIVRSMSAWGERHFRRAQPAD